jgi:flagellar basal-body rod protein FlgG
MLERLGGGHWVQPTHVDFTQGALMETGNDLDLAIRGDGFFVATTGDGEGPEHLRLTRDGRLTRNTRGELVMQDTGLRLLDVNNRPIRLRGQGPVHVNERGEVGQDGTAVARIQLATVADLTQLTKAGQNLYRLDSAPQPIDGHIMQGQLEASAVNSITTLTALIAATKAVQGNAKMMQYHDHVIGQAVNTLGRVA